MKHARAFLLVALLATAGAAGDLECAVLTLELGRSYDDALLRRAAASGAAAERRAAATAAGRLRDERALAWLLPLLKDAAGPVRRSALFALGQIGTEGLVIPLRSALPGLPASDLPRALEALGKTRDPRAVTEVAQHLDHADSHVRGAAALALFRLQDPSALPDVFAALAGEEDAEVRWRLVYAAAMLVRQRARPKGPVAVDEPGPRLLRAAAGGDRPYHERYFAVRGLAWTAGQRAFLSGLLDDTDPRVVRAALLGLSLEWDDATAQRAVALLDDPDPLTREAAVDHLLAGHGRLEDPLARARAAAFLTRAAETLADDARLHVKARAAAAAAGEKVAVAGAAGSAEIAEELAWRVNTHFPDAMPRTTPTTAKGRLAAAEACGEERVPEEVALKVLLELLEVDDFVVQATAIGALAKRGASRHAPAVVAAARAAHGTANHDVRVEAANALKEWKLNDPWLEEAAAGDPDHPVRAAAAAALAALGQEPPTAPRRDGFRLHGHDAAGIAAAARGLRGARVVLETSRGRIEMVLLPDEAPAHCVNFAVLVQRGFYDGLTWHRVVPSFVIQGGCPLGNGWGGPGYLLPDEIGTRPYVRGTVGMPKAGDDTGGCQIFITHVPTPHLDGRYSVFAQVVAGLDVVDRIRIGDTIVKATLTMPG